MDLPTREQCMQMLKEHKVPQNIVNHVLLVNKVAVFLAKKLKQAGVDINIKLVDRASLLHDIAKLKGRGDIHGEEAEKIITKAGYPEVAKVASKHVFIATFLEDLAWEEKVLQYADKRCMRDRIVSVDKKYDYFLERYGNTSGKLEKAREIMKQREKEIFSLLDIKPEQLKELVK